MGVYYDFYRPWDMKLIASGKYSGMPFLWNDCKIKLYPDDSESIDYTCTCIIGRKEAEELQEQMHSNNTLFTDLMNENATDTLIVRIT